MQLTETAAISLTSFHRRQVVRTALLLWALSLLSVSPAYAYLDPAAGNMLVQLLLGGAAGLIVALRLGWRRIVGMLRPRNLQSDTLPATPVDDKRSPN